MLQPADLGLILSYHCQCSCSHCLYNCGPTWPDWAGPSTLAEAFQALSAWEVPPQVHLTGGEPFLNFPLLLEAIQIAAGLGIRRYAETNGGWCVNDDLAHKRFEAARQAGLQAILISASPFHAETIAPAVTLRAIRSACNVFGPDRVMVYQAEWLQQICRFDLEKPTPLRAYSDLLGPERAGRLLWEGYGLMAGGRCGYRLGGLIPGRPASAFQGNDCAVELLYAPHSHFDLYGNFIPGFCGGLSLGNWQALPAILDKARAGKFSPLITLLVHSGPFGLYEFARHEYGYTSPAAGFAGKCHLCVDVRHHLTKYNEFAELCPNIFYTNLV